MDSFIQSWKGRAWLLAACVAACTLAYWVPVAELLRLSVNNDNASHTPLIPIISLWLLWLERPRIFTKTAFDPTAAAPFGVAGIAVTALCLWGLHDVAPQTRLSGLIASLVLLWVAAFLGIFGREAGRKALFPLAFLFLTVPLPQQALERVIYFLQWGSTELSAWLFDLIGEPALREGFVFHLPKVTIEVARECSGIRSSIAILILALVATHLYLRAPWRKVVFLVVSVLVMILKNAVRIVTLTMLASYVDPRFLTGPLHHDGGILFFLVGLAILLPLFVLLQRGDAGPKAAAPPSVEAAKQPG